MVRTPGGNDDTEPLVPHDADGNQSLEMSSTGIRARADIGVSPAIRIPDLGRGPIAGYVSVSVQSRRCRQCKCDLPHGPTAGQRDRRVVIQVHSPVSPESYSGVGEQGTPTWEFASRVSPCCDGARGFKRCKVLLGPKRCVVRLVLGTWRRFASSYVLFMPAGLSSRSTQSMNRKTSDACWPGSARLAPLLPWVRAVALCLQPPP